MRRRRTVRRRRIVLIALVAVAGMLTGAWYGDLASAIPLDITAPSDSVPLLQSAETALRLAEREMLLRGGMPHDARLGEVSPSEGRLYVNGYAFMYHPQDVIGLHDRIIAEVVASPTRMCLDDGTLGGVYGPQSCRHYREAFPLRVTWLYREWRPRAVRAVTRWWNGLTGPMIAPPSSVQTGCAHPDQRAMRRVVGARWDFLQLKGRFDPPVLWEPSAAAARAGGGAVLTWSPPYPTVRFQAWRAGALDHIDVRQAVVLDGPVGGRPERLVLVKYVLTDDVRRDAARRHVRVLHDVDAVISADDEPVCPRAPVPSAAPPHAPMRTWESAVEVIRKRAEDEGFWLVRSAPPPVQTETSGAGRYQRTGSTVSTEIVTGVVGMDRHPGGTSTIDVETTHGDVRWRGRYSVDERAIEILGAEYTRL